MNALLRPLSRRAAGAELLAASLVAALAGSLVGGPAGGSDPTALPAGTSIVTSAGSSRIVLRSGDEVATATLVETPAARQFAAMLPLQLSLDDPMGQAQSSQLPRPTAGVGVGVETVSDPDKGGIYYWPSSHKLAIFYVDLGQTVPSPGLVRLGTVDSGLDTIATA
jgi:hypothetical protein